MTPMNNHTVEKIESTASVYKAGKIKRFFFICVLVIVPLVIMELFSFTYIKLTSEKGTFRERINDVANPYHPYLGYVHAPHATYNISKATSGKGALVTDENGYSITPSFSYSNPDITIVVTGGSTIFGVGSSDNSSTVPSILERIINERLKVRTEVVNLALRGSQSFQEMLIVDRFLAEKRADFVLAISGRNDASQAIDEPIVEGAFLRRHIWDNAVSIVHRAEKGDLMIIGLINKLRYWSYTFDFLYRQIKGQSNPDIDLISSAGPPKLNLRREGSTNLKQRAKITATHFAAQDQISKMNGAAFVMILQPTLYTKNNWTEKETQRIKKQHNSEDLIESYRQKEHEFYAAFRETEKPFQFIDLSGVFAESHETLYIDQCHYNDLGAKKFAEKIFESIQALLLEKLKKE
jgi:lysophospholipase L1-like esterase